jgi:L-fuconate dehydratase
MAIARLETGSKIAGSGIALTLGAGNSLVCDAINRLAGRLVGLEINELMTRFGAFSRQLADDPSLRWLGPHKGVVHLALASITNACFDLWAKSRGVPLWKLLLDLAPEELLATLDLSYVEDVLSSDEALDLLRRHEASRSTRESILRSGYPGYDTSVGWMAYDDAKVRELTIQAIEKGFRAFKLKVGSADEARDLRRAAMLREVAGDDGIVMFDANQRWNLPKARVMCQELATFRPLWIEEPTHPDDIVGHAALVREIAPVGIALGEHVSNRVLFKNFLEYNAVHYVQADCTRLAGVSEFLVVSLMAKKFGLPIVPHVGDMGQIHQHLVLFNHIALDHEVVFLEHIPHLREHFVFPAEVAGGVYKTPQQPGASTDMIVPSESR